MSIELDADRSIDRRALTPAQLKELSARSNEPGLIRALAHYGAIVLVGTLLWQVMIRYGLVWAVPLLLAQGFLVAFLFMPLHEAAHKTVFRSKYMNLALGHLSALMIIYPYEAYALFHWDHHRFTQDPQRDPELLNATIPTSDTRLAVTYSGIVQLVKRIVALVRRATGDAVAPWIPENKRAMVVREARAYLAVYLVLLVASLALSSTMLLWVWLLPLFIGQAFLRPYLLAEHTGCERTRSAFENTRTTYTGDVMKWFTWNMPFHVEHHAYPSVPFHALPKLNAIVDERITHKGRGYRAVTRQTWAWFRQARLNGG
ncbi:MULTISPECIES: fatty acid desaturase [Rhodopseudomonas]|uniref:Fatty acid desaturase n=1 Tax=Rhodopseudomonas palustris TaxID=1076 RepID=A0A0D7DWK2_RHOPL|nr:MULTISPECIES: fatty acid desaturase [Rhodopseudomonas]KIZ32656.1 fatty acid desaturase [Rhodopseudomonas palustris]MDF3812104.1 fatty acid desaturase [Rhodopseudomonas sp. BAL398]WOK16572.1 fatty acid desaturase [Rhodopseudomonas sp. BAL398]